MKYLESAIREYFQTIVWARAIVFKRQHVKLSIPYHPMRRPYPKNNSIVNR
jgi:hypothetical protein